MNMSEVTDPDISSKIIKKLLKAYQESQKDLMGEGNNVYKLEDIKSLTAIPQ